MKGIITLCAGLGVLGLAASAAALSASDFEDTPFFVETFNGPVGKWEIDPDNNQAGVTAATFGASPVAGSADNAVMIQGNLSSTYGTAFGLNYMRCVNSKADGTGEDFTQLKKYRVVARLYLYAPSDITSPNNRWQVGPFALDRSGGNALFRASAFYNAFTVGLGPGFGYRAYHDGSADVNSGLISGTSALSTSRWTLMSVMVDMTDADPANWKLALCVDADGDGILEEDNPLEYLSTRLASTATAGPPGIFTVGDVHSDQNPLYVDTVELYKEVTSSSVNEWSLYE